MIFGTETGQLLELVHAVVNFPFNPPSVYSAKFICRSLYSVLSLVNRLPPLTFTIPRGTKFHIYTIHSLSKESDSPLGFLVTILF